MATSGGNEGTAEAKFIGLVSLGSISRKEDGLNIGRKFAGGSKE